MTVPGNASDLLYGLNFDNNSNNLGALGSLCYGKYKVLFNWSNNPEYEFEGDTLQMEWDSTAAGGDVILNFRDDSPGPRVTYKMELWGNFPERLISDTSINRHFKIWRPYGYNPPSGWTYDRDKSFGDFHYVNQSYFVHGIPLDCRRDCNVTSLSGSPIEQNHVFTDNRNGILTLNLTFDDDFHTRDTLLDNPTSIAVTTGAFLKISSGKIFTMTTPVYPAYSYTNLIVQTGAKLTLMPQSKIIVYSPNVVTLNSGGTINLNNLSEIRFKPGSAFCNQGGIIRGGNIIFEKGFHYLACATVNDFIGRDSLKIVLEDSAVLVLPEDISIKLTGKESKLILNPYSKILFGENSKIVIDSSAKIIANNATFARPPAVSPAKWAGRPACSEAGI